MQKESKQTNIVSFSGGKDSTAMLLMMLEKKMPVDDIVFCDTGMEFPQIYEHIKKVEEYINRKVTVVKNEKTYEYLLGEHVKRNGKIGYGHPDFRNRWCTYILKNLPFARYIKKFDNVVEFHGIAANEKHRSDKNSRRRRIIQYPLIEWGVTEKMALEYCYNKGFDWGGLYKKFTRASCWCCPLSRIDELRVLYNDFPELWTKLVEMDKKSFRKFKSYCSVEDLTNRFAEENKKLAQNQQDSSTG